MLPTQDLTKSGLQLLLKLKRRIPQIRFKIFGAPKNFQCLLHICIRFANKMLPRSFVFKNGLFSGELSVDDVTDLRYDERERTLLA